MQIESLIIIKQVAFQKWFERWDWVCSLHLFWQVIPKSWSSDCKGSITFLWINPAFLKGVVPGQTIQDQNLLIEIHLKFVK